MSGRKCYVTPTFSGVPKHRGKKSKLVASPLPSQGPTSGRKHYITSTFSGVPKQRGTKSKLGPSPPAFSGAHEWAQMPHNPCILGGPQTKRDNIKIGCLTPALSVVDCASLTPTQGATQQRVGGEKKGKKVGGKMCSPTKGNKIRSGCLTLAFSGAQKRAEMLRHPCILGDPQTKGDKIRSGSLTPAFSGAHKWVEMLRHLCILGDPQNKGGQNQNWPTSGRKHYTTLACSGVPKQRGAKPELATSPLPSREATSGRKCYIAVV